MKKSILFILALSLHGLLISQSCLPDGIIFTAQSQIDSFRINYPNCTDIKGFVKIIGNNKLDIKNLNGLIGVKSIGGNLSISYNDSLMSLEGLDSLISVEKSLGIGYNASLISLDGLGALVTIEQELAVVRNASLTSFDGLNSLTFASDLLIVENPALTNLTGLSSMTSMWFGGDVSIGGNSSLTSLKGLDNVISIGLGISIAKNPMLTNLIGLPDVTQAWWGIEIWGNDSLTSLEGLPLADIRGDVSIYDNPKLSICEVESVCNYLSDPKGETYISDNANGCNSIIDVQEKCMTVGIDDVNGDSKFSVYPNPATDHITIVPPENMAESMQLLIYNVTGRIVFQREIDQAATIQLGHKLAAGTYFYQVRDAYGHIVQTDKILILRE